MPDAANPNSPAWSVTIERVDAPTEPATYTAVEPSEHHAPVRWGILGAGNIAHRFAASLQHDPRAQLVAVSCRTQAKADAFAAQHPVAAGSATAPVAYASHDALLADPNVDAIYLALPHGLHLKWSLKAIAAGKAVLCEKPCALSAKEVRRIAHAATARGTLFMEAMKTRFMPLYREVRRLVATGTIGRVTNIDTVLCNDMVDHIAAKGSYHADPVQGGALYDCGIYCACWLADYLAGRIGYAYAKAVRYGKVEYHATVDLYFGDTPATLETAFDEQRPRTATIEGELGKIVVDELHRPTHATVYVNGQPPYELDLPPQSTTSSPRSSTSTRSSWPARARATSCPSLPASAWRRSSTSAARPARATSTTRTTTSRTTSSMTSTRTTSRTTMRMTASIASPSSASIYSPASTA